MIRPATSDDVGTVVGLAVSSGLFAPAEAVVVHAMMTEHFRSRADDGAGCLLDEDDVAVGVAYYEPAAATQGAWYLTMIAVRAGRQGQGRGGALLRRVEDDLRACGERLLLVETSGVPAFGRTRSFYRAAGYDEEARVRDYYAAGDDMVLFRKALST